MRDAPAPPKASPKSQNPLLSSPSLPWSLFVLMNTGCSAPLYSANRLFGELLFEHVRCNAYPHSALSFMFKLCTSIYLVGFYGVIIVLLLPCSAFFVCTKKGRASSIWVLFNPPGLVLLSFSRFMFSIQCQFSSVSLSLPLSPPGAPPPMQYSSTVGIASV